MRWAARTLRVPVPPPRRIRSRGRWDAATIAGLVLVGLTGCSAGHTIAGTSPSPTPSAVPLTGDAAFDAPIICRADHDYATVAAAIASRDLVMIHTAAAAAAKDEAAGFDEERAHTWTPAVRPLLQAYFAVGDQQVQYYRDVAAAGSIDDAVALRFPDGTTVTRPVWIAMAFPTDYRCP